MNGNIDFYIPDCEEFRRGYEIYNKREKRGLIYFESLRIVTEGWGNPEKMAKGVQRLIRAWNRFYANFNFNDLINCINQNMERLNTFRKKEIFELTEKDDEIIKSLFNEFLFALRREKDKAKSPVSVAKALGLLAPGFLPIWDSNIAFAYHCFYFSDTADSSYIKFCYKMKSLAENIKHCVPNSDDRTLLKRIDEYNYSKYTMNWI